MFKTSMDFPKIAWCCLYKCFQLYHRYKMWQGKKRSYRDKKVYCCHTQMNQVGSAEHVKMG